MDCGTCDFCIDKPKFGGSNKKRQKCRLRQCQKQAMVRVDYSHMMTCQSYQHLRVTQFLANPFELVLVIKQWPYSLLCHEWTPNNVFNGALMCMYVFDRDTCCPFSWVRLILGPKRVGCSLAGLDLTLHTVARPSQRKVKHRSGKWTWISLMI